MKRAFPVLMVVWLLAVSPSAWAQQTKDFLKSNPKVLAAFHDVVKTPAKSTVRILVDGKEAALGTIVGPDGWILTKASELGGSVSCKLADGRTLPAHVVGLHDPYDLALLRVEARNLTPIVWAESSTDPVGNWVASPGTGPEPVSIGVISVATRKVSPKSWPHAVAGSGFLGISTEAEGKGLKILQVQSGTAASRAGLKVDDRILTIQGQAINDRDTLFDILGKRKSGDVVHLRIQRGDKELDIEATLGRRPLDRGDIQNAMGGKLSNRRIGFPTILQHDSVLRPSDCGGPIVDLDGKAIGVNIARAGRTESYAVPTEVVLPLLFDLATGKFQASGAIAALKAEPKPLSPDNKIAQAREALEKILAEKAALERRVAEAKAALDQAITAQKAREDSKKVSTTKPELKNGQQQARPADQTTGSDAKAGSKR